MGADIHGVIQVKKDGKWETVAEGWNDRSYRIFAVLGNVRNGTGFAGVYTHDPIPPISDNRGFPKDFETLDEDHVWVPWECSYADEGEEHRYWLGDHSYSWVSLAELKNYDFAVTTEEGGVVEEKDYVKWHEEKTLRPKSWYGDVRGGDSITLTEDEYKAGKAEVFRDKNLPEDKEIYPVLRGKTVHVKCAWHVTIGEMVGGHFLEWIRSLDEYLPDAGGDPENIRFVFGFDS